MAAFESKCPEADGYDYVFYAFTTAGSRMVVNTIPLPEDSTEDADYFYTKKLATLE